MEQLHDYRFWLLIGMATVWVLRARQALHTLRLVPTIRPAPNGQASVRELVTVIVPVRNEEKNIDACLKALLIQDYPCLEIIVANDHSTDKTEEILKSIVSRSESEGTAQDSLSSPETNPADSPAGARPIRYFSVPETPEGWTGKNFALHSAISLARGSLLLFTDADTRHEQSSVSAAAAHVRLHDLKLLTLLPRCLTGSWFEDILQPTAMGYLGLWFPIEKTNDPRSPLHFGNGQYLLIDRKLYQKIGGHEKVRGEFLEDFGLMKNAKAAGARAQCAFGTFLYGTRMYDSFASFWRGWRRIYLHAFERNARVLLKRALGVLFFSVIPFTGFIALTISACRQPGSEGFLWGFLACLLLFITAIAWKTYDMVRAKKIFALLHPLASVVLAMVLLDAAWMAASKAETKWR